MSEIEVRRIRATGYRALVMLVGLALVIVATGVPAYFLAGEDTLVDVSVALSLSIAATIGGGGAVLWGRKQKARADRLERRNKGLSRDVKELQQRLSDAGKSPNLSR